MWAQIYFDDISSTFTVLSSVTYKAMPGSTAFTGESFSNDYFKTEPADSTSARIIIGRLGNGVARAQWAASFTGNQGNNTYHIAMFRNGTKLENLSAERKLGTAGDIGNANSHGFIKVKNGDSIDIRVNAGGTTGVQVTFNHCNMNLQLITTSTHFGTV